MSANKMVELNKKDSDAKRFKQKTPVVSGDAKIAEDMKNAGNESFKSRKFDEAIEYYTRGIRADPRNIALLANRALAYMKIGKIDLVVKDCNSCLGLDPGNVKAHLRRGAIRFARGKLAEAKDDFMMVRIVEPNNREALAGLEKIRDITAFMAGLGKPEVLPQGKKPAEALPQSNRVARKRPHNALEKTGPTLGFQMGTTLPGVPDKSFQFFGDWMRLEGHRELRYQYLRNFPARKFPEMFRHSMEADVFASILRVLREDFLPRNDDVFEYVKFLAGVGRFKTLLCMLSDLEKKYVGELMRHIESLEGHDSADKSDIRRMYEQ